MDATSEQRTGLGAAFAAFGVWGFLPIYFNLLGTRVSVVEVVFQRVLWSALLLGAVTLLLGRRARLRAVLANRRLLGALALSASMLAVNWGVFVWAVTHGHILEASLGYYINPLLNVALGFLFLRERLRPAQTLAVGTAAAGVVLMVVHFGQVPWIALTLASAFALYGLVRKQVPTDGVTGLLVETGLLGPFALAGLVALYAHHAGAIPGVGWRIGLLLAGSGAVTIVPLVLFATAARRLPLSTLGLIQYIAPTLQLVSGVYLYGEPFTRADAITFAFIWTGLALYSADTLRAQRARRLRAAH